jgi:hypothetical protein
LFGATGGDWGVVMGFGETDGDGSIDEDPTGVGDVAGVELGRLQAVKQIVPIAINSLKYFTIIFGKIMLIL